MGQLPVVGDASEGRQKQRAMREGEKARGRRREETVDCCAGRLMGPRVRFRAGT